MTEEDLILFVSGLPGVVVVTAGEANGAPESAWGDTFFFYDPDGDTPDDRRFPFATLVVTDYPNFDTASDLNRPGVFRLNVAAGRQAFEELLGYPPAAHAEHAGDYDYSAFDLFMPHPVYAAQGWVSIVNPGDGSVGKVRSVLTAAHARDAGRHRPR